MTQASVSCRMGAGGRKHRRYRRTHPPGPAMVKANHPFTKTLDAIARQFGKRPNRIPHYHTPEQMRAHDLSLRCRFARKHRGAHQQDPFTGNVKPCPICNPAQARTIAETGASTAGARAILAMAVERKLAKKEQ